MKCAKFGVVTANTTVDISDLNLSSAEDYCVLVNGGAYGQSTVGGVTGQLDNKTATSFDIKVIGGKAVSYQVITFR
jgi:hypothetical protein